MTDNETAAWNGDRLTMLAHYDWPEPHDTTHEVVKITPQDKDCHYWVACDGECFGLRGISSTCIAIVEQMLHASGVKATYVTFANKDRSDGAWKRWQTKWSKRTTGRIDAFDASVRSY